MKYQALILSLLLAITANLFADTTYDVEIPADQIDTSNFVDNLESKLSEDIKAYLGNNDFVISVDANISTIQRMVKETNQTDSLESASEIVDYALPGLLDITPKNLKKAVSPSKDRVQTTFRKINKITIKLTVDSGISQEQEDFLKNLINHKAKLDPIRGDKLDITKTSFSKSAIDELFSSKNKGDSSLFSQSSLMKLLIGLISLLVLAGIIVLVVFFIKKIKKPQEDFVQSSNNANAFPVPDSVNSTSEQLSPHLEYTKQDLVSLSLGNKGLAEEMINEAQMGAESEKVLGSIYLTLGERLFHKLYPNVNMRKIKEYLQNNTIEKAEVASRFEYFTTKLAEKNELEGSKYRPFHFLDNLDNAQILYLLQDEAPKIKALALSQLSPSRAAEVIQSIDKNEQANVAFELSQFDQLPIESFKDIANKLAIRAQRVPSYSNIDIDGIQLLLNMLDNMSHAGVNEFLSKLQSDSPDTYYKLRQIYFIFDDIMNIPANILKTIVREFPRNDIAMALQDVSPEFSEHLLSSLPSRLAGAIREEISLNKDKTNSLKVEEAKQNITNIVRHLIKHNRLSVSDLVKEQTE